jgi:ABC-type glycerol-3-phosphate transport system permease component
VPPDLFEYLFAAPGPTGSFYRQLAPLLTIGFGTGLGISFVYYLISGMLFGKSPLRRLAVRVVLLTSMVINALGLFAVFLRQAQWGILSYRFVLVLIAIIQVYILVRTFWYLFKTLPREIRESAEKRNKKRGRWRRKRPTKRKKR